MPLSYAQLRTPVTEDQATTFILDTLTSLGFRTGNWSDGSVQKNLVKAVARNTAGAGKVVSDLVFNLVDNPNGDWLDLLGKFFYILDRDPGAHAVRLVTLTVAPSAPPQVIENGTQLRASSVSFSITGLGAPVTVPSGTSAVFTATADKVGVDGNTGVPPRVIGKTGTTAVWTGDPSTAGVDIESDSRYLTRCQLRFFATTYSVGLRAYEFWALTSDPSIARAKAIRIFDLSGDLVAIHVVIDAGTAGQITNATNYIAGRNPPRDTPTVIARDLFPLLIRLRPIMPAGTTNAQVQAIVQGVLDSMPIGGWPVAGAVAGRFLMERISEALLCKNGAKGAGIISPAGDVILGATEIIDPTYDIQVSYG